MKYEQQTCCEYCESEFTLRYSEDLVHGNPTFCPFCGEEHDAIDESYIEDSGQSHEDE
jgi:hypothetical protein